MKSAPVVLAGAVVALVCLTPSVAAARTQATLSYPYAKVWPTIVRFLRIDEGFRVTEKDSEAGYVLFEVEEDGHIFRGSFEIAKVRDQQRRNASRVIVQIHDRPAYMEQGLIDRLELKLRRELGEPAPPPAAPEPKPERKKKPDNVPRDKAGEDREDGEKKTAAD